MRKVWIGVWLCCLLSMVGAQADPLELSVSFREPAQRVQQTLEALSTRTQLKLLASHTLKDEIVLIDAERVTLRQLMEGLALALDAEWRKQPDGSYRLGRTVSHAQRRIAADESVFARKWLEELERLAPPDVEDTLTEEQVRLSMRQVRQTLEAATELDKESEWNLFRQERLTSRLYGMSPTNRFLFRLLRRVDWGAALHIPIGEYRTYSNLQGAFLLPFKENPQPLLQQFFEEMAIVRAVLEDPTDGIVDAWEQYKKRRRSLYPLELYLPLRNAKLPTTPAVYLCLIRSDEFEFEFLLDVVDIAVSPPAYYAGEGMILRLPEEKLRAPSDLNWREAPVRWSELGQLQWQAMRKEDNLPSAELLKQIDPALVEPLSLVATDILRSYARAHKKPLIALLHDTAANPFLTVNSIFLNESPLLGNLEEYLLQWEWSAGEWLVAKPRFASQWWNRRYQRERLASLVAQVRRRGYMGMAEVCLAAQLAPDSQILSAAQWWLTLNGIRIKSFLIDACFVNALGAHTWGRLQMGETLELGELPAAALRVLHNLLFQQWQRANLYTADGKNISRGGLYPVFFYPNGLHPAMRIRLRQEPEFGFFQQRRNGVWTDFSGLVHAHLQALIRGGYEPQTDETQNDTEYIERRRTFRNPEQVQYALEITFGWEILLPHEDVVHIKAGYLTDYQLVGKPTRWDKPPLAALPAFETVREQVKRRFESLRQEMEQEDE